MDRLKPKGASSSISHFSYNPGNRLSYGADITGLIFPQMSGDCMARGCNIRHSPMAQYSHITRWALRLDRPVHKEAQFQVGDLQIRDAWSKQLSHIFERRRLCVRWSLVSVLSASRPRLRRLRRARKPAASKNPPADHQGRRHLAGVDRCSPGAGLRSSLELRSSSGSCRSNNVDEMWTPLVYAGVLSMVVSKVSYEGQW